jgi:hypothetical protein
MVQDLEDTTGSWELYGTDDDRRYPSLQNEFFERAARPDAPGFHAGFHLCRCGAALALSTTDKAAPWLLLCEVLAEVSLG